jgi:hypothetical protein
VDEKGNPLWVASTLLLDEIYKGKNRGSISILLLYVVYLLVNPKGFRDEGLLTKEKLWGFKSFLKVVDLTDDVVE